MGQRGIHKNTIHKNTFKLCELFFANKKLLKQEVLNNYNTE